MILTDKFCAAQPHVTLTVVNQDGSTVTDTVMAGSFGLFAGMIGDAIRNPIHKTALDAHIAFTRFCGKSRAEILAAVNARKGV
jgi:hypothetical protein